MIARKVYVDGIRARVRFYDVVPGDFVHNALYASPLRVVKATHASGGSVILVLSTRYGIRDTFRVHGPRLVELGDPGRATCWSSR